MYTGYNFYMTLIRYKRGTIAIGRRFMLVNTESIFYVSKKIIRMHPTE
jgi:hypothetical protein